MSDFIHKPGSTMDSVATIRNHQYEGDRRLFLKSGVALAAAGAMTSSTHADDTQNQTQNSPGDRVVMGIMGVNGRGSAIARGMMAAGNTEVAYVCDVDTRAAGRVSELVGEVQKKEPKVVGDFRRILDDTGVDVLVVAAPPTPTAHAATLPATATTTCTARCLHSLLMRWWLPCN